MADLENRFKGFITDGEKKVDEVKWRPQEDKIKLKKEKESSKNYHPVIFLLVMIVLVGSILGGGYIYLNQVPQKKADEVNLAQSAVEQTPSPTPIPTAVPKDKVKVLILNGTGIKGQAGKVQISLEKLSYKLIDVEIAEEESESTVVEYKSGLITAEDLEDIKVVLEKTYSNIEIKENPSLDRLKITTGNLKKSS